MKSILISIQPKWVGKILNGEKTVEVRKTAPKCELPIEVYIYCTYGQGLIEYADEVLPNHLIGEKISKGKEYGNTVNGKVVAKFTLNKVDKLLNHSIAFTVENEPLAFGGEVLKLSCLNYDSLKSYANENDVYAWHISDLQVFDKPKELGELYSVKQCEPVDNIYGEKQTWEQRHKRCIATGRGVPIECYNCKNLISGADYLDEKSGVMLFDYHCETNHHAPLKRPPQSWQFVEVVHD